MSGIAGIGITFQDTHLEELELRRFADADDANVGRTVCLRYAIDLRIGQPLGTWTAIGAQQSQVRTIDMEAPTTVVLGGL